MHTRLESDSIGSMEIPPEAYYGIHSLRAGQNFPITGRRLHPLLIESLAKIKKASAICNCRAGLLEEHIAFAIAEACDEIIEGRLRDAFIVDPIQGGAGTSANMNANEVIANRAIELLGGKKGDYSLVHPIDHVNMSQSTNDVFPTAGKLTALTLLPIAVKELKRLHDALEGKAVEFDDVIKMGRTQLQDAVPIRLGQSFHAYALVVQRDIARLERAARELETINMGGTAIGTSVNASPAYVSAIVGVLREVSGCNVRAAEDLVDTTQNLDGFVNLSGSLKTCAVSLSKMANDLRLLSMGPRTGLAEINLPPRQNGSSIMPGKINPVIPEVVSQVAFHIMGNDLTITMAAEGGQLELNAFEPVLFYNLFESLETLTGAVRTFVDNCVCGITANRDRCQELLDRSVGTVTALCPYIGYKKAASLAKTSLQTGVPLRDLVRREELMSDEELAAVLDPFAMTKPQDLGHMAVRVN